MKIIKKGNLEAFICGFKTVSEKIQDFKGSRWNLKDVVKNLSVRCGRKIIAVSTVTQDH